MPEQVVLSEIDPRGVATVTLNRPAVNNAYDGEFVSALRQTFVSLAGDARVRVVTIRGSGRHFQAGADLSWIKRVGELDSAENIRVSRDTAALVQDLTEFPRPTIALVHGACMGGGTGIVSACDIVIASADALFAVSEARWGVIASIIFPHLNAAMGVRNVRRYALSCERFDAHRAREMGLVHEVCAPGALDAAAAPVIDGLLMAGPEALVQSKRDILATAGLVRDEAVFERLVRAHAAQRQSGEAREGLSSFTEKRKPSWYTG